MHKESRGFLGALEEYADVALNLLSFFFAYVITVLIEREATIELSSPYAILIIFVNTVVLSFFYHLANFYKKHGYEVIGVLPDIPSGNQKYLLMKAL